ncbi:efflux RND transporter periplasmic adaptor subunit [Candidatus Enterococcus ikei]|uniref:HlyD family efflux transporter periplasmic adaptor subunit n=1 Tax=Candidatus Enterococcus ikei TaxID=2815326 RepID=A0ABS3GXZ0_9ENTE|nr:HlyD family efflux transporter periplasmic adaptor subunit [Enterococcus sp. DIV0869a]MBO0439314.1 HlyD family efflux transporter periplasmic adaptor subunit [Enterococcus sp. DIV0869a]
MKKKTIFGILAVLIVAVVIFSIVQVNAGKTNTISVRTGEVKKETIIEKLSTTGTLIPNQTQTLMGTGNVIDVNVAVGDKVEKDAVLATYDNGLQLIASFNGTITQVNIKAKQADTNAQQGKASIQLDDLSTLKVQLELSNSEASAVALNQKVEITSGNQTFNGKIAEKDPVAVTTQSATGTNASLGAVVTFDKAPENLFAGFDADVDITTNTVENVLSLPIEALTYNDKNEPIVYVIKDNQAKETKIKIGIQSDKLIEVKSGLKENDTVILSPNSDIKNKTEVTKE